MSLRKAVQMPWDDVRAKVALPFRRGGGGASAGDNDVADDGGGGAAAGTDARLARQAPSRLLGEHLLFLCLCLGEELLALEHRDGARRARALGAAVARAVASRPPRISAPRARHCQ